VCLYTCVCLCVYACVCVRVLFVPVYACVFMCVRAFAPPAQAPT